MKKTVFILLALSLCFFENPLKALEEPSNLIIKDIKKTNGLEKVVDGMIVHFHYRGWLYDKNLDVKDFCQAKGKMFDSTLDKGFRSENATVGTEEVEFIFEKGKNNVIKGWEIGTENMSIGDKRCIVIPPKLAYGSRRIGNVIPPNSTLIFEIELVKIREK